MFTDTQDHKTNHHDWIWFDPVLQTVTATILISITEAPTRMDLASYLTIRTLLFFESLIGLVAKLIKGDPPSWKSWTLYYIFTADLKHASWPLFWEKRGPSIEIFIHTCTKANAHTHTYLASSGDLTWEFLAWSHYTWPSACGSRSSVWVRDWC